MTSQAKKGLAIVAIVLTAAAVGFYVWKKMRPKDEALIRSNGRIEATEIDVAAKLAGRVQNILVDEGDFVQAGQVLAQMQTDVLEAQREEARAQHQQAIDSVASAQAQVASRESDKAAAEAVVVQRESELDAAPRRRSPQPKHKQPPRAA